MESPKRKPGCPLQLVTLNMDAKKCEVNEDALGRLEKRLKEMGAKMVAIVSVMGAFRTGKSFLLDLFLRFLKWEADHPEEAAAARSESQPARGGNEDFPLPAWITTAGANIEGASEDDEGFRFKGGMDACTEGIWVWSEPFLRQLNGQEVAVLLMDTQGAWDSNMTKEQSATVFGLTAVLSSKQIYNINMQIQEDKVENLAYFMRFAQAELNKAASEMEREGKPLSREEIDRPFQSLDFLVRDWRHFRDDWTVEQCMEQMQQHLSRHVNPQKMVENSTAEALHAMFKRLQCFCLPHPGLIIEKDTWTGKVADINRDFIRFMDLYVRDVFTTGLSTKNILGSELSTMSFPHVLRNFVDAFHDAAPAAMSFTQAMTNCTVLLAKEAAMKSFIKKMDEEASRNPRGMKPEEFTSISRTVTQQVEDDYKSMTIFGSDDTRKDTWTEICKNLDNLRQRYEEDNARRLEKALVAFANISLIGLALFLLDRISDWTCDWWSQTCTDLSKLMLLAYVLIFGYVGVQAYLALHDRGRVAAAMAGGELWKEMVRLMGLYGELLQEMELKEVPGWLKEQALNLYNQATGGAASSDSKNKKD
ncbi:ATL2 [Symbiodinium sp. CCMP2592]|nr:ATL2 [Symbiodinium sp. CCMP2592]